MTQRSLSFAAALSGVAVFASSALADAPSLLFPVDCELGETCFLQQFVDRDAGPDARDFTCGPQSYDGHQGTDIRLADFEALSLGWPVLAAASGTVLGSRNTVADGGIAMMPEGQDCGNGVCWTMGMAGRPNIAIWPKARSRFSRAIRSRRGPLWARSGSQAALSFHIFI